MASLNRLHGFTLLELIIAISLVGLIMILSYSGMRVALRSWSQAEAVIVNEDEVRLVHGFLRRQLAQVQAGGDSTASSDGAFKGTARRVDFVAPMPGGRVGVSGYYRFTLEFVQADSGLNLQVAYSLDVPTTSSNGVADEDHSRVLVQDIESGEFSYFGTTNAFDSASWHTLWQQDASLPQLVRVRLNTRNQAIEWPDMVFPIVARGAG